MSASRRHRSERDQLDLFRALPGDLAPRDAQDSMAYPFFSLAKSKRITPIDFHAGTVTIRVEAVPEHGMATIWDADVLIWAASQIVEARDAGLKTSRLMAATPYEILTFVGRGTSVRDYDRLKAALDRLQSTTVMTSIRQPTERRRHRFSWINEWKETADLHGHARGLELILPDWFYTGVLNEALVLTIDRAYFDLTGGLERWLYRLVRKHGGHQEGGPPEPLATFLDLNGYLPIGVPMLKRVLALPGQTVCRKGSTISVDAIDMGDALPRDRRGRPLPVWQGCRVVGADELFLMNWQSEDSLDGRYFGLVPASSVIGKAQPVWTKEERS